MELFLKRKLFYENHICPKCKIGFSLVSMNVRKVGYQNPIMIDGFELSNMKMKTWFSNQFKNTFANIVSVREKEITRLGRSKFAKKFQQPKSQKQFFDTKQTN